MKKTSISIILMSMLGASASVIAQEEQTWVAGFAEYYNADEDKFMYQTKDRIDFGFGGEFGQRFSENWGARIEIAHLNFDNYDSTPEVDGPRFGMDVLYYLNQPGAYVFGGYKIEELNQSHSMLNLGVGKHWALTPRWKLVTEVAAYHEFGESYRDFSAKVGLAYYFGDVAEASSYSADSDNDGVEDSVDQCPNSAPGARVNANGCALNADTDGDGVLNQNDRCPATAPMSNVDSFGCVVVKTGDADGDGIADTLDKCPNTPADNKVGNDGCSLFSSGKESISLALLFDNNSSVITNPDHKDIRLFADFMKRYPNVKAIIEGHTSAMGAASYNMSLSEKRAKAVVDLLVSEYGVEKSRLTAVGYGESRLLDSSGTAQANKKNRRIEASLEAETKKVIKR